MPRAMRFSRTSGVQPTTSTMLSYGLRFRFMAFPSRVLGQEEPGEVPPVGIGEIDGRHRRLRACR